MSIKSIAIGIFNATKAKFGTPDPKVEQLALKKLEVCATCDERYKDEDLGDRCGLCDCVLGWMSRSPKMCKDGKWDNI